VEGLDKAFLLRLERYATEFMGDIPHEEMDSAQGFSQRSGECHKGYDKGKFANLFLSHAKRQGLPQNSGTEHSRAVEVFHGAKESFPQRERVGTDTMEPLHSQ
jgi:hypothetical protein